MIWLEYHCYTTELSIMPPITYIILQYIVLWKSKKECEKRREKKERKDKGRNVEVLKKVREKIGERRRKRT